MLEFFISLRENCVKTAAGRQRGNWFLKYYFSIGITDLKKIFYLTAALILGNWFCKISTAVKI